MAIDNESNGAASGLDAPAGSEYRIETVEDFLKVPEDRIADCLKEFADFLAMSRDMLKITQLMSEILGAEDASKICAYTWIDDGKKEKSTRLVPNAEVSHPTKED
jgi:hypothetical protein